MLFRVPSWQGLTKEQRKSSASTVARNYRNKGSSTLLVRNNADPRMLTDCIQKRVRSNREAQCQPQSIKPQPPNGHAISTTTSIPKGFGLGFRV